MSPAPRPLAERFHEKYTPEPNSGCWIWTAKLNNKGYGVLGRRDDGSSLAHRTSYELHKGSPTGLEVCHSCDTPSCVNPDHLFLGTHTDNQRDASVKGRLTGYGQRDHCHLGHEFTPENTHWATTVRGTKAKICRECARQRTNANRRKHGR